MIINVLIDKKEALKQGYDFGRDTREAMSIDPTTLPTEIREYIAENLETDSHNLRNTWVVCPSVDGLLVAIRKKLDERAAEKAKRDDEVRQEVNRILALESVDEWNGMNRPLGTPYALQDAVYKNADVRAHVRRLRDEYVIREISRASNLTQVCNRDGEKYLRYTGHPFADDPRMADLVAAEKRRVEQHNAACDIRVAERKREEEEREQSRQTQLADWVREYGTESQRERHARGLLDTREVLDTVSDVLFKSFEAAEFPRYERPSLADVVEHYQGHGVHVDDDRDDSAKVLWKFVPLETMTEEQFAILKRAEQAAPDGAGVVLGRMIGVLPDTDHEDDDIGRVEDLVAVATINLKSGWVFEREYGPFLPRDAGD